MVMHSADIAPTDPGLCRSLPVRAHVGGRDWNGWWDIDSEGRVCISSAYGSMKDDKPIGRRNAAKRAEELFREVVQRSSFNSVAEIHQARKRRPRGEEP